MRQDLTQHPIRLCHGEAATHRPPTEGDLLTLLIDIEGALEEQRVTDDGRYNLTRHVMVMIAIMGEARMVQAARAPLP